jgi:short-subunit dehydrogenase
MTAPGACVIVGMGPGVSRAVARRFAADGHAIGMIARRVHALETAAAELAGDGIPTAWAAADAGDPVSLRAAIAELTHRLGPPDVLLYNALSSHRGAPTQLDPTGALADLAVNAVGALVAVQAVAPAMIERRRGTILLTGGGLALTPIPFLSSLAMGKAAIRSLAGSLAGELAPHGIRVGTVTICGAVQDGTPFAADRVAELFHQLHAGRPGDPYELVLTADGVTSTADAR